MPASLIAATFFEAGTVAYAATYLGVRVLSTIVIANLLKQDQPQDPNSSSVGGKIQLPAATICAPASSSS